MRIDLAYSRKRRFLAWFQFVLVAAVILFSLLLTSDLKGQEKRVRGISGQQAPAWDVSDWHQLPNDMESLNVNDFEDQVTYLYFFQSWCPGCHKSGFPTLKHLTEKYADDPKVEFVAIQTTFEGYHTNTVEKLREMADRYELEIPFGQSAGQRGTPEIMQNYRSGGTPWVVIIDKQGVVRFNDFHIARDAAEQLIDRLKTD